MKGAKGSGVQVPEFRNQNGGLLREGTDANWEIGGEKERGRREFRAIRERNGAFRAVGSSNRLGMAVPQAISEQMLACAAREHGRIEPRMTLMARI